VFLGGQAVSMLGDGLAILAIPLLVLAEAIAGVLGGDPRPVFAAAGSLTLLTVAVAWFAGLRASTCRPAS
jgi:hypothetical protein